MILSLFHCSPHALRTVPGLASSLRRAGVRHCEMQVWRNPGSDPDLPTWVRNDAATIGKEIEWTKQNDWDFVARFDDGFRTPPEHANLLKWDGDAVRLKAQELYECGNCIGVELCDEMKQDPREYPYLEEFIEIWGANCGPCFACPGHAPQRLEKLPGWPYISRQWNWWTCKVGQDRLNRLRGSLVDAPKDGRPICALIDVSGPRYRKRVKGTEYKPGKDQLLYNRRPPSLLNIEKQFQLALDMGATRFRCWAIDTPEWKRLRAEAPLGAVCDTGMGPCDERWAGFLQVLKRFTS